MDPRRRHERGQALEQLQRRQQQPGCTAPGFGAVVDQMLGIELAYLFDSLDEVRDITEEWLERYNEIRPHDALGSLPPARHREQLLAAETPG